MVYYTRTLLALFFSLGTLISAKEEIPSLKQIIREIPEDNIRSKITSAYLLSKFDDVKSGLISYINEYNFEGGSAVKEKARLIINDRVEEMRVGAAFNDPVFQLGADPGSFEDTEELSTFEIVKASMESLILRPRVISYLEAGSPKAETLLLLDLHEMISNENITFTEDETKSLEDMIHDKVATLQDSTKNSDFMESGEDEEGLSAFQMVKATMESLVFAIQFIREHNFNITEAEVKALEDTIHNQIEPLIKDEADPGISEHEEGPSPFEIVKSVIEFMVLNPDVMYYVIGGVSTKAELFMSDKLNDFISAENLVFTEEEKTTLEGIIHDKVEFLLEDAESLSLMEGKSGTVEILHDIAVTQQKIVELINELEGGF